MTVTAHLEQATVSSAAHEEPDADRIARTVHRLRLAAVCVVLHAVAFVQAPGRIVGDTKVDLAVDPGSLIARVLHLWDPSGSFGQVQNQAYGYLWPMGPFFYLGHVMSIPPWVIQRLWWGLVLCVAFVGLVRLAGRLGIGTPPTRIVAGLAFALAPRFLTSLGPISIESWPSALAPWVLLPLVGVLAGRPLWRAAARSALAVACVGGVNAAATLAVLPLPVLFLLTLRPRWAALRLGIYWVVFVGLATAWWVGPLLLLGQYSPPFLNFIETANATTFPTSLVEVLRGTSHWVAYMSDSSGPLWYAGWIIVTNPIVVLDTVVLTCLGLLGLGRRGMPHRGWLISAVLVGVACVTFGHLGDVQGLLAGRQHELLDGVLAPLRNVHKYDVLLRLPLALGVAHMFGLLGRAGAAWRSRPAANTVMRVALRPAFLYSMAIIALLGTALPALAGAIPTRGSFQAVPQYWRDAAGWLDAQDERGAVLVVPASNFAEYEWGRTVDEIVQPLLRRPWAIRNAIPLAPPGTIRMLDEIEDRIATGDGSPALAEILARAGVKYLVVRNDLDYGTTGAARPLLVHQSLDRSPGIRLARAFGPLQSDGSTIFSYVDQGLAKRYPAVEVYSVERPVEVAAAYPVADMPVVAGGPESLLPLAEAGVLGPAPAVLAGDLPGGIVPPRTALTDDLRRREVAFGALHGGSATLTADDPFRLQSPTHDYLPTWAAGHQTVAEVTGAKSVDASSSRADATAFGGPRPENAPFAAIDDDLATSWRSDPGRPPTGQWWRVRFATPIDVSALGVTFDGQGATPVRVRVATDGGDQLVSVGGNTAVVVLPRTVRTGFLRIRVEEIAEARLGAASVGIANVGIAGFAAGRTLVLPTTTALAGQPVLSFSRAPGQFGGCYWADGHPTCATGVARPSEDGRSLDRTVHLASAGEYRVRVRARPHASDQLNSLLDAGRAGVAVTASSTSVPDPAGRPAMAADGDPNTGWIAAYGDRQPSMRLAWIGARPISRVRLFHDPSLAASVATRVRLTSGEATREATVDRAGYLRISPPIIADSVTITFLQQGFMRSTDPYTRANSLLPVGVSEVQLLDVPDPRKPHDLDATLRLPCGSGPTIRAGDREVLTAVTATRRELQELRDVRAEPCGGLQTLAVAAGRQRIVAGATPVFDATALALTPSAEPARAPAARALDTTIERWGATNRSVRVGARSGQAVLAIKENVNPGWRASLDGAPLKSFTVDGWHQGWLLPAGAAGVVTLTFAPDQEYRLALAVGGLGLALVLIVALLRGRRRTCPAPEAWGSWGLLSLLGAVALLMIGGAAAAVGVAVMLVADAALWWWGSPRLIRAVRWLTPALAYGAAGLLLTARPWPTAGYVGDDAVTQLLALAALTVLWVSCDVGEWLAETVAGWALRARGSSPRPPDTRPGT